MTKLKLDLDGIEDDFFAGTRLLGIMSLMKNYRFCWLINGELGFDFRLNADVEIQLKRKGRYYFFPVYQFWQTECELEHYIYHTGYGPTNETLGKYIRELFGQNVPAEVAFDAKGSTQVLEHKARAQSKT